MRVKSYPRVMVSFLILAGLVYLAGYMIYVTFFVVDLTYKADFGELNIEKKAQAIVIRSETLVTAQNGGTLEWHVVEGDKVKKSQKLATLKVDRSIAAAKTSDAPETLSVEKVGEMIKVDLKKLDQEMVLLASEINKAVDEQNYKYLVTLKRDLVLKMERKKRLLDSQDLIKKGASSFKKTYLGAQNVTTGNIVDYFSSENGVVTFQTDGLENVVTLDNLYNIDYEILMAGGLNPKTLGATAITPGLEIMKLVDQSSWFVVALIDKEEIDSYEKNKKIGVTINGRTYAGTVSDAFENNKKGALIVKMSELYENFHKERFIDTTIVRENYKGIKIRRSSVITQNGMQGVFIIGADERAMFRPIKILGDQGEDVIVKSGYIQTLIGTEIKRVKTIDVNNRIIIEPSGVREGMRIEE